MKDELYFLRFGFVKKMIVRKHITLVKESIESLCRDEGDENLNDEMIEELKKGFLKSDDEIIREWIDFYGANRDSALLRRIFESLPLHPTTKNMNIKPLTGFRFLIQYLNWWFD